MKRSIGILIVFGIVAVLLVFLAIAFGRAALAHDAPSGWKYPQACCGEHDCKPIPCEGIKYVSPDCREWHGISYCNTADGGVQIKRVRPSGDEQCHECHIKDNTFGICIFIKPGENS